MEQFPGVVRPAIFLGQKPALEVKTRTENNSNY
jgi:hypothetical protein